MFASSLTPYAQLDGKGQYTPGGSSGYSVDGGGYNQAPVPLPALGFKELAPSPAIMSAIPVRAYLGHAGDHAAAGRRHGSDRPRNLRSGEARRAAEDACDCDPPDRATGVRIEHGPGQQVTEADFCICTLPLPILARIPSDFSPAKKAAHRGGTGLSSQRQACVRGAPFLGDRRLHFRRARLDRSHERKCDLSLRRLRQRPRASSWARIARAGPTRTSRTPSRHCRTRNASVISREFDRGAAPRPVAPARKADHGRVGPHSIFGRRRRALAGLRPASGRRRTPPAAPAMRSC